MRRWILRAILALAVLTAIGFITVQLVLRSDLPRRAALEQLAAQTGLHWSASSLDVRWNGTSTLRDVTISLPLEDQPLLTAPLVEAVHPSLLALLFGAPLDLQSVSVRAGNAVIRQNDRGEWNFARVVSMIDQRQRARDARATTRVPALQISGIAVDLIRDGERDGARTPLGELRCDGAHRMARYEFKASLGTANRLDGMLALGDTWSHEITFDLQELGTLLHLLDDHAPQQLTATGAWAGAVSNGTLTGRLQLASLETPLDTPIGPVRASGTMQVEAAADGASIEMRNVEFRIPALHDALRVTSGTLHADADSVDVRGVVLRSGAIGAELDGSWDRARRATELDARWRTNSHGSTDGHVGTVKASFTQPLIGEPHGSATFETSGSIAEHSWRALGEVSVRGSDVESLTGDVRLSALTGTVAGHEFDLSGTALSAARHGDRIALTRVHVPGADVTAHGEWNTASGAWSLAADSERLKQPWLSANPVSMEIRAAGSGDTATLERFILESSELSVEASAEYAAATTEPLTADISITVTSIAETIKALSMPSESGPPRTLAVLDTTELSGRVTLASHITGSLDPVQLQVRGTMRAKELRLTAHAVASTEIPFDAIVDTREVQFTTTRASLFGGSFLTHGRMALADGLQAHVEFDRVQLDAVVAPVHADVQSLGSVSGDVDIEVPAFRMKESTLNGAWSVRGIKTRYSDVDVADGRVRSAAGVVELSDVRLQHLDGSATGSLQYDSGDDEIRATIELDDWPVRRNAVPSAAGPSNEPALRARINGGGSVRFHPTAKTAQGRADFSTTVLNSDEELVNGAVRSTFDGDAVQFELVNAAAFGGTINGHGTIPFAKLMNSEGTFTFASLQLDRIRHYWPDVVGFAGKIDGRATIASVTDVRAPGPMRIDVQVVPRDAAFHSAVLGPSELRIYAGPDHVTLEHAQIRVADGTLTVWSKLTEHASDYLVRLHASFDRIDLDQLIESVNPGSEAVPGRLAGQIAAGGYLAAPHRMYGQAKVRISESDLGNIGAVSLIYGALHLGGPGATPTGAGDANISLEGNALVLRRLTYFNRGTDLIANLVIDDMWAGRTSSMRGAAAGVARPLKDIDLPFFDDLDRAVKALQTSSVVVRITGTVENRELKIVPFADVAGTLLSNP